MTTDKAPSANDTNKKSHQKVESAEALLLNCMDYRLVDNVQRFMKSRGLYDRYDQVTIAGAAIGVLTDQHTEWGDTFWEHLSLARELHNIRTIIVIDHRDCAACKSLIESDCAVDRDSEFQIHERWLTQLALEIYRNEPNLTVELYLMDLDGSVEEIAAPTVP